MKMRRLKSPATILSSFSFSSPLCSSFSSFSSSSSWSSSLFPLFISGKEIDGGFLNSSRVVVNKKNNFTTPLFHFSTTTNNSSQAKIQLHPSTFCIPFRHSPSVSVEALKKYCNDTGYLKPMKCVDFSPSMLHPVWIPFYVFDLTVRFHFEGHFFRGDDKIEIHEESHPIKFGPDNRDCHVYAGISFLRPRIRPMLVVSIENARPVQKSDFELTSTFLSSSSFDSTERQDQQEKEEEENNQSSSSSQTNTVPYNNKDEQKEEIQKKKKKKGKEEEEEEGLVREVSVDHFRMSVNAAFAIVKERLKQRQRSEALERLKEIGAEKVRLRLKMKRDYARVLRLFTPIYSIDYHHMGLFILNYYISADHLFVSGSRHYDPGKVATIMGSLFFLTSSFILSSSSWMTLIASTGGISILAFFITCFSPIIDRWRMGFDQIYWIFRHHLVRFLYRFRERLETWIDELGILHYDGDEQVRRYFKGGGGGEEGNPYNDDVGNRKRSARTRCLDPKIEKEWDESFRILQLDPHFHHSKTEIENAFRRLVLIFHPDKYETDQTKKREMEIHTRQLTKARRNLQLYVSKQKENFKISMT